MCGTPRPKRVLDATKLKNNLEPETAQKGSFFIYGARMNDSITKLLDEVPTPILDVVRLVCLDSSGKVLLVQESDDINWKLPGGKVHQDETVLQASEREIKEELGIDFLADNITNIVKVTIPDSRDYRYIIRYSLNTLDFKPNDEVSKAEYYALDNLPETKFARHISSAVELTNS